MLQRVLWLHCSLGQASGGAQMGSVSVAPCQTSIAASFSCHYHIHVDHCSWSLFCVKLTWKSVLTVRDSRYLPGSYCQLFLSARWESHSSDLFSASDVAWLSRNKAFFFPWISLIQLHNSVDNPLLFCLVLRTSNQKSVHGSRLSVFQVLSGYFLWQITSTGKGGKCCVTQYLRCKPVPVL